MSSSRTPVVATAALVVTFTAAVMPFMHMQASTSPAFMPSLIAAVAVFDLMSVYLLLGDFRDRGDTRFLVTALAYVWSLTTMLGYALAFPGAVFTDPPLALSDSVAPYIYLGWHVGFPLLLGLAWAPWPARFLTTAESGHRLRLAVAGTVGTTVCAAGMVLLICAFAQQLPVLIVGLDTSRMTKVTARLIVPLVALALLATVRGTWHRTGPERWASVAVLASMCDLVLTYASRTRFSVGWYAGRSMTIVATGVVLVAMLASFRKLKAQAERDAFLDPLTQLLNRRGAFATLDLMFGQPRREGSRLGVIMVDLDLFKSVNDRHGHEAGDSVLTEVGAVLNQSVRGRDVAARVGGEEFLVILHDTDSAGVLVAAERLRAQIAAVAVPGVRIPVTASVGATVLEPQDADPAAILRRADAALYDAKNNGKNRVEGRFRDVLPVVKTA